MSRFLDGPAIDSALLLRRAPRYLRVTIAPNGKIDGLDQLDDEPTATELVVVYRRVTPAILTHINFGRSSRSMTGFYEIADYRLVPDVDGETVRETAAWRAWCVAMAEAEGEAGSELASRGAGGDASHVDRGHG